MTTTLDETVSASRTQPLPTVGAEPGGGSSTARRLAAGAVDAFVLTAGLALVIGTELAIATAEEVEWALVGWTLVFTPLYFALYHAWERGGTPGQLELGLAVRDVRTHARPTPARAISRSYLGLAFAVLVVPAVVDVAVLVASRKSLRDRLTGTAVVPVPVVQRAPELTGATDPSLLAIFEPPAGTRRYLRRGWSLLRARPQPLLGSVAAVYGVLVAVLLVTGVLFVADAPEDPWGVAAFAVVAMTLLASGVYWAQAVIVLAVEEARVGSTAAIGPTLVRAVRRANALSAALVVLLLFTVVATTLVLPLVLAGRVALVAPALVLEDSRVFGAFRRSWELTSGQTVRTGGLVVLSALLLAVVPFAVDIVPKPAAERLSGDPGLAGWVGAAALAIPPLVAFAVVLAWLGAAWSLLYEDARRRRPPEGGR